MATVMMLENVLASLALMETSVTHVLRIFLDFHAAKVFISFQFSSRSWANPGEVSMNSNSLDKTLNFILNTLPRTLAP